ncbi:MAG: B12-binding domain-containing radical SAM protein [Planctomycetia bacterium]|nr:B12-binding domain-containing radical SAM protein [Planctomycetia bacterium]
MNRRRILLIQLPIPQPGMAPAQGNVPLAAGYLKLLARLRGLEEGYDIEILPAHLANTLSDRALAAEILGRDPWLVGWTCYLWNVERSLDVSRLVKQIRPETRVLVGGPEITADNDWVLERPEVDFAAIGEGEQTFVELLAEPAANDIPRQPIAGLYVSPALARTVRGSFCDAPVARGELPLFRKPLPSLDEVSSPYLAGILDAADEQMLLLETLRGCVFKCKFCYYPKSYDDLYFVSREKIAANLEHARRRGAREVVLLDPTLNQRRDFDDFLNLLAECNPERQFTYFGELRAEGITPKIARLLREANFKQVEIGLQSIDPLAQELMDRRNNMKAFERGVRALRDEGIGVKVDLIIGLPGDTRDSVRRSLHYLKGSNLYDETQVFNLAVLPGTAFRQEASSLGLEYQSRPPYYVLKTPTLELADLYSLMDEAEEAFETEFDPLPEPELELPADDTTAVEHSICRAWCVDLDRESDSITLPPADERAQAFSLWLRAADFRQHQDAACGIVARLLDENPHTTLQVVLESDDPTTITPAFLAELKRTCYRRTTYLDRFYSILPGPMKGSKRLVVLTSAGEGDTDALAEFATIVRPACAPQ